MSIHIPHTHGIHSGGCSWQGGKYQGDQIYRPTAIYSLQLLLK